MKRRRLCLALLTPIVAPVPPQLRASPHPDHPRRDAHLTLKAADTGAPRGPGGLIDVRQFGVVANDISAAARNTAALRSLLDPHESGPAGTVIFPNVSGRDVYQFCGVIPVRDGIHIDLMGSTARCTGTVTAGDRNTGLFFALRDFTCENGTIEIECDTGPATGSGHAIQIGARGNDSSHFTVWDSLLPIPMGNIQLRNLRISVRNRGANLSGSAAIGILGGVRNLVAENIVIDGNGTLPWGIYYEFGWATPEADPKTRQTSHAHNMRFTNISAKNLNSKEGAALALVGAYSCIVEGLHVTAANTGLLCYPGESMFYRPWVGVDQAGVKNAILVRNIIAQSLTGTAIVLTGAQTAAHGYLGPAFARLPLPSIYRYETDLGEFSLDGFGIYDCSGWGIYTSAGGAQFRNGSIRRCQRGIVATDECTKLLIEGVDILECQEHGVQLNFGVALWSPPRTKKFGLRDSYIAGNSASSPGRFPGVEIGATTDSAVIENCRFGYEQAYSGTPETTQGDAIFVAGTATSNVICRGNRVGGIAGNSNYAYRSIATGTASANGNTIEHATGINTAYGNWLTKLESKLSQSLASGGRIAIQNLRIVRVKPLAPVSGIILEPGYEPGQTITIINESANGNSITFAVSPTSNVASAPPDTIQGLTARSYVWDSGTRLWYRT